MKPRGKFSVVEFENPNKTTSWRVTGTKLNGERVRENYQSEAEALAIKQQLEIEGMNSVTDKRVTVTRLTPEQEREAEEVYKRIKDKSLTFVADFFLANYYEPVTPITVKEALDKFLEAKRKDGNREATIRNLKNRVGLLAKDLPDKLVSEILRSHVQTILSRPGIDRVTADNDRRALSSFFSWCSDEAQGFCRGNPAKKNGRGRRPKDETEPAILNLGQVRSLLTAAENYKDGKLVPYVTLGLFAAIRPAELARLKWDAINLRTCTVTISGKIAKLRSRRVVEMVGLTDRDKQGNEIKLAPSLIDWLAPHALKRTPIRGTNWRKDFDAVKAAAGLVELKEIKGKARKQVINTGWDQDVLRHTGISHHFALYKQEGKTAEWAGNSPAMIHAHYKGLVEPGDSEKFFAMKPVEAESNIVPHAAVAAVAQ